MEHSVGLSSNQLPLPLVHLGEALLANGDTSAALEAFERAMKLSGAEGLNLPEALVGSSDALLTLKRPVEAVERLERALTRLSTRPQGPLARRARFRLAAALWATPATRARAIEVARECLNGASADETQQVNDWLATHRLRTAKPSDLSDQRR
jgi:tetratricopeptide (TPR) repeat protein